MDPNSDLNMLSDPEHPQALEHHVQLKAGTYSPSLCSLSERMNVVSVDSVTPLSWSVHQRNHLCMQVGSVLLVWTPSN